MIFNTDYNLYSPLRYSRGPIAPDSDIERPIEPGLVDLRSVGASVPEGGRSGHFLQSATASIRAGAGKIELQTSLGGGGEPVGAGSYGKQAREAIREMTKAAQVEVSSVHTPTQIGNLSGFNPQQGGFSDEQKKMGVEEVKKAIEFAADVAQGGAIVIHTGEYQRSISDQPWAKNPDGSFKFIGFQEEPGRAASYLVDDRTGRIIQDIRKSSVIREPIYKESEDEHWGEDIRGNKILIKKGDWVNNEGKYIDPSNPEDLFKRVPIWNTEKTRFESRKLGWNEIEERAKWYNQKNPDKQVTPEEMAYKIQLETQMLQYRGQSLYHGRTYDDSKKQREALKKAYDYYVELEKHVPKDEAWKIMVRDNPIPYGKAHQFIPGENKLPSEILKKEIDDADKNMLYIHESSASADAQADLIQDNLEHVKSVDKYALEQSERSYAEAGIYAMEMSRLKNVKKPIFLAAENIFPEMGFGSHPEELITLIEGARKEMVRLLTTPRIEDPHKRFDKDGKLQMVENPFYRSMSKEQAAKEAEEHVMAMIDTQHLGMWRVNFVPKQGETKEQTDKRFNEWYLDEVKKMADKKIIGHIHLVDSITTGHHALPIGQGNLPLKETIMELKKRGYKGSIISEGWEEDRFQSQRILTEAWSQFGSPVYSNHFVGRFGPTHWNQMQHGWYGQTVPPMYIFGAYAPSNEWSLWTEVPLE